MGCDLFDPEVQMAWAEGLRRDKGKSNKRVEPQVLPAPCFRPLGYAKPKGISKMPNHEHKVKAGNHNDGFSSSAFVAESSIFFRCSYTMEKTERANDGAMQHFWRVKNAWFELCEWAAVSISEAVEMASPYIASPHNSDMMIPIMRKLERPYWPSRPSKIRHQVNSQKHTDLQKRQQHWTKP
jgi:hypothetical protein